MMCQYSNLMKNKHFPLLAFLFLFAGLNAQVAEIKYIPAEVDFSVKISDWDGFGFNYVETAQTRDYSGYQQDYGEFSLLSAEQKEEILEMIFGPEGLQVQIVKMFLDPYHQPEPGGTFFHETTTRNMLFFVDGGLRLTRDRGDELEIITTLYGTPSWATKQRVIGGRDLDERQVPNLCRYLAGWVKFLTARGYPVNYLSLHNEGEDFYRWNFDDGTQRLLRFDYNMYWPPAQVNIFLRALPAVMAEHGLQSVGLTNVESSNWTRFYHWGYARALYEDEMAMENLALLTTHGFINGDMGKLSYGTAHSLTTDLLRRKKPGLHAWVTSFSWGQMGVDFIRMVHEHIYAARVNAIVPWAGIQHPAGWIDGDPNPGCAFRVKADSSYEVMKGYYFYQQLTRAGYRGMAVAKASLANPQAHIIAFAGNGSGHPDAFVVTSNIFIWSLPIEIRIRGTKSTRFMAYRSSEDGTEKFSEIGQFELIDGVIIYDPPRGTTTTFIAMD
jgi:O-glycosyl hydrolase